MTIDRKRGTIGVLVILALTIAVIVWRWLFPPFPDEEDVIALYTAHKQEFAALSKMIEKHCDGHLMPEAAALASRVNPRMRVVCDYDGTVRFILGVRGLMTIGPERIIGLTYFQGDPARKGSVVPALGPHEQEVGYDYLREVDNHWYVFTQNTD
jgi:hypothetical protein